MSLRLSDLWAPAWSITLRGQRYRMRPLSLGTFADLEGEGITLSSLSRKARPGTWARLFIFLADLEGEDADEERILAELLQDPIAFKRFQENLANALQDRTKAKQQQSTKRQVKNPLEGKKKTDMREEESETEELDASFLLMVARLSGLSLNDLSRMSFAGVLLVQHWLKDNPPQPSMGGLFG